MATEIPPYWQQGMLLDTPTTRRMRSDERGMESHREACSVYTHFTPEDEGRSRQYIGAFRNPEDAALAVKLQNAYVDSLRGIKRPKGKKIITRTIKEK